MHVVLVAVPASFERGVEKDFHLARCLAWRPDPPTEQQLDPPFVADLGMLDVPPRARDLPRTRTSAALRRRPADGALPDPERVIGRSS